MTPTAVRCRLLLTFCGLLLATRALATQAFALPAPDSVSLARLQIQVVQLNRARVLTVRSPLEIKKPAVGAAIVVAGAGAGAILGSASPRWEKIYPEKYLDEKPKAWRSKLER